MREYRLMLNNEHCRNLIQPADNLLSLDLRNNVNEVIMSVYWGNFWPDTWASRLAMLSAAPRDLLLVWPPGFILQIVWDDLVLYCDRPELFFAALAECKMHVAAETADPLQKTQLLCDAKAHLDKAISLKPFWRRSHLAQMISINPIISSYSEIRKNALILAQGKRDEESLLRSLPDELLTKIAGLTGTPAAHSEAESEEIARKYFCRPPVNTAEHAATANPADQATPVTPADQATTVNPEDHVTQGDRPPSFWSNPTAHQRLPEPLQESTSNPSHGPRL
jgi:hypothetical protein